MKNTAKRLFALVLAFAMVCTMLPVNALATELNSEEETVQTEPVPTETVVTEPAPTAAEEELTEDESVPEEADDEPVQETVVEETTQTVEAQDEVPQVETMSLTYINPVYAGVITEADLNAPAEPGIQLLADSEYLTVDEAADVMREYMVARTESFQISIQTTQTDFSALVDEVTMAAVEHTGVPTEGDYLLWQYAGFHSSTSYYSSGGTYYHTVTFTTTYYTTAAQEAEVTTAVNSLLSELGVSSMTTNYDKIKAVYDYICDNVTYDYDGLESGTSKLIYTAYAALINGTSVCQGYANLLYRLALEMGIDCRLVAGDSNGDGYSDHAWSIVQMDDGKYYNADATWDTNYAASDNYQYFLKCDANFPDHTPGSDENGMDFTSAAFLAAYPKGTTDFDPSTLDSGEVEAAIVARGECGADGDNLTWTLTEDGLLTVSGKGDMYDYIAVTSTPWYDYSDQVLMVVIERGATSIGNYAFAQCENLTDVSLPDGLTRIGGRAFYYCKKLQNAPIPDTVTDISVGAFWDCQSLTSVNIPDGITIIENSAFCGCSSLTSVEIPDSVVTIDTYGFYGCTGLTKVEIPEGVQIIGDKAFTSCSAMQSVTIPDTVISIGVNAFSGCEALTAVYITDMTAWCEIDFFYTEDDSFNAESNPLSLAGNLYLNSALVTDLVIPSGVTAIKNIAFTACTSLTSVSIPNTVTSIGALAFYECVGLTEVTIPDSVVTIGDFVFMNCSGLTSAVIGNGVTSIGQGAFFFCENLTTVTLGSSVEAIGQEAFGSCPLLESIYIPDSVTLIDDWAFMGSGMTEVIIGNGNIDIQAEAFSFCKNLVNVVIGANPACIRNFAFANCESLKTVTFQGNAPTIEDPAFSNVTATVYYPAHNGTWTSDIMQDYGGALTWETYGTENSYIAEGTCGDALTWSLTEDGTLTISGTGAMIDDASDNLWAEYKDSITKVVIEEGVTSIGDNAFLSFEYATDVTIPSSVTSIGARAFDGAGLTSLTIPTSVTSVGENAFEDCDSLPSVVLPNSLTAISKGMFSSCDALTSVTMPDSVTIIGEGAFDWCRSLTEITIPDSVTSIANDTFYYCTSLTEIDMPNSITSIGEFAFAHCTALPGIVLPDNITAISTCMFYECDGLTSIVVPEGVTTIGTEAFRNCDALGTVVLPDTVTSIGDRAFTNCASLTSIKMPGGLLSIGGSAFHSCALLETITIPAVASIGSNAFAYCDSLDSVYFEGDAPTFDETAFYYTTTTVYYPADNATWTSDVMQQYGGTIEWVAYGETEETTEITLWTYPIGGWSNEATVEALIAEFEAANPGISVSVEYLNYMTGDDTVNSAIENGSTPDIIMEGPERLVVSWSDHMVDLSGLLDNTDKSEIYSGVLNACYGSDGALYEYPLAGTVHTMAINKAVFEAAGAMQYIDEETRTWKSTEAFFDAVQAVYEYTGSTVGTVYCGGQGGDQGTRALVTNLGGGSYTNASHTAYTWTDAAIIEALTALYDCEGIEFDSTIFGGDEIALFYNGSLNMAFCWNIAQQLNPNYANTGAGLTADGDEIMFVAFPSNSEPELQGGVWGFGVFDNGNDAKIEAAKTFVKYMCDSEATVDAVAASTYFAVRGTAEGTDLSAVWADDAVRSEYSDLMQYLGDYYQVTTNWAEARTAWWNLLQDVGEGQDIVETVTYWNAVANGEEAEEPSGKTELSVVAAQYGSESAAWWTQFEEDFEAAHEDIDLIVNVASWNDIYDIVDTSIAAGEAPDILNIDGFASYQAQDLLLPVQDYMSDETYTKFYESFLEQSEIDGTVWAVPDLASARGLYYNTAIFEELGLEAPSTWSELEAACAAIAEYSDVIPWGIDMSANEGFAAFAMYTWANGGGFVDEDGNWALNSAANKDAINFAVSLYNNGYTNDTSLTRYDLQDMFMEGNVAMMIAPDSFASALDGVIDYGVAALPASDGQTAYSIGVMDRFMCFDNGYSDEELAAVTAFFDFFYNDDRYVAWTQMEGFLPATASGMEVAAATGVVPVPWMTALANCKFYPANKAEWSTVRSGVCDVFAEVIAGGDTQTILDELQAEVVGTPDDPNTLTIWASQADQDWLLTQVEAFLAEHPEYADLTFEFGVCNAGDASSNVTSNVDVYLYAYDQISTLTDKGVLAPLSGDALAQVQESNSEMMVATLTDVDGNVYGVPMSSNTWFMYYNKNIFSEEDVTNLNTMLEKGTVAFPIQNSWYLPSFYFAAGGTMYGEYGNDASAGIQFGSDNCVLMTKALVELVSLDNFVNDVDGAGSTGLKDGTVDAYFSGSWDYAGLYEALGEDLGMAQLPTITLYGDDGNEAFTGQMKAFLGSTAFGVNAQSENAEAAQALAVYLGSAEAQLARYNSNGVIPTAAGISDTQLSALAVAQRNTADNTAVIQPTIPEMSNYWSWGAEMGNVLANGMVTADNAAEVTANFNNALNGTYSSELVPGSSVDGTYGGLTWHLSSDGVLTISGDAAMEDQTSASGYPWYEYKDRIERVFCYGATNIGDHAFENYTNLEYAMTSNADGVVTTAIGAYAFAGTTGMNDVNFSEGLTTIEAYAFRNSSIWYINFEGDPPAIDATAFAGVTADAVYPYGNENWTSDVMKDYGGDLNWYESVGTIASGSWNNGYWDVLTNGSLNIYNWSGAAQAMPDLAAEEYPWYDYKDGVTSIYVGDDWTSIGTNAFANFTNLEYVTIRPTVVSIGANAFGGCTGLSDIYFAGAGPEIAADAFNGVDATASYSSMQGGWDSVTGSSYGGTITWRDRDGSFGGTLTLGEEMTVTISGGEIVNYTFTPTETGYYVLTSDGFEYDPYCELYDSDGNWLVSDDDSGGNLNFSLMYQLTAGQTYRYAVRTLSDADNATFTILLDTPVTSGACGDSLSWDLTDEVLTISGTGAMSDFEWNTAPWHIYSSMITSVVIEEGVTTIGNYAFQSCGALTSATIPASVTYIGIVPFGYCDNLTSIQVDEANTYYCSDESGVLYELSDGAKYLLLQAPGALTGQYDIPEGVEVICYSAFESCNSLTGVTIPDSVTTIDDYAFNWCKNLASVTLPSNLTTISVQMFCGCESLTSIEIPDSVTTIKYNAFAYCDALESITMPAYITSISNYAFEWNRNLSEITFQSDAPEISSYAFYGVTATAYYPADNTTWTSDVMQDYGGNLTWTSYEGGVDTSIINGTCGENVTWSLNKNTGVLTISGTGETWDFENERASWYNYRTRITSVVVEEGVTYIGSYAFMNCSNLVSVQLPDTLISLGICVFDSTGLTEITIPANLESVNMLSFYGCPTLSAINVDADNDVFCSDGQILYSKDMTVLQLVAPAVSGSVTVPETVKEIAACAFLGCYGVTEITLHDELEYIGSEAFEETAITSIEIPASVTGIGDYAFAWCPQLTEICVDADNLNYSNDAYGALLDKEQTQLLCLPSGFAGEYVMPDTVTTMLPQSVSVMDGLTSVILSENLTEIPTYAFYNCPALTAITIPASVTSIGYCAFMRCTALSEITFEGDAPEFDNYAFYDVTGTAYYPANASGWSEAVTSTYCGTVDWVVYGTCGDDLTWKLITAGTLTISGTGAMYDYSSAAAARSAAVYSSGETAPWSDYADSITAIVVEEGVTSIGSYAFYSCENLTEVTVGEDVASIGTNAFAGCGTEEAPVTVTFTGDVPAVDETAFAGATATVEYPADNETWSEVEPETFGGAVTLEPVVNGTVTKKGNTLSLEGLIYINHYVLFNDFNESIDQAYIEANGGLLVWNSAITAEEAVYGHADADVNEGLIYSATGYMGRTDGIAVAEYADELYMRAYLKLPDGTYVYGPLDEYSVQSYCEGRLEKSSNEKLKNVCAALLHFGASAQVYFNYNVNDLANANIAATWPADEFDSALLTDVDEINTGIATSSNITTVGKSLSLEGAILINYYFRPSFTPATAELLFWEGAEGELTEANVSYTAELKYTTSYSGCYHAQSEDIASGKYDTTIFCCAKFVDADGNTHYSEVIAYSPEAYAAGRIEKSTNENMVETVKRMVIYGEYAKIYFGQN